MKRSVFVFVFAFLFLFLASLPLVLSAPNLTIDNAINQLQDNPDKLQNISYNYLADQWKEILLKNRLVAAFDTAFTQFNWFFAVFFARNWSLSLEFLFAFLLWTFTYLSLQSYVSAWFDKDWAKVAAAFAGTVIVAHLQIYNYLSKSAIRVIFYKSSFVWSLLTFMMVMGLLYLYLYINHRYSKALKNARERRERLEADAEIRASKAFRKEIREGMN